MEKILEEWRKDAIISESDLSGELIKVPKLHSKYLDHLMRFKRQLSSAVSKRNKMAYLRKLYYRGEMTKEQLVEQKWEQYQGLKMSTSEFNQHSIIDPILVDYQKILDVLNDNIKGLEYILSQLKSREFSLKALMDYQKFLSGN